MTVPYRHYAAARSSYVGEFAASIRDFAESFKLFKLWTTLGFNDILQRYRGSVLGPFWITLTTGAFVLGIGLVYGQLMGVPTERYVPWIATGVVVWNFIAIMIMEGTDTFIAGGPIIRQTSIPLPVFLWRVAFRNVLNFLHQLPVVIVVALWFNYILDIHYIQALLGVALLIVNMTWIALLFAIISSRFRDVQQVVTSVLQLAFFLSPVVWIPSDLARMRPILEVNPFFHFLEVTRNPLLGLDVEFRHWAYLLVLAGVGWVATFAVFAAVRRRVVHYI